MNECNDLIRFIAIIYNQVISSAMLLSALTSLIYSWLIFQKFKLTDVFDFQDILGLMGEKRMSMDWFQFNEI